MRIHPPSGLPGFDMRRIAQIVLATPPGSGRAEGARAGACRISSAPRPGVAAARGALSGLSVGLCRGRCAKCWTGDSAFTPIFRDASAWPGHGAEAHGRND